MIVSVSYERDNWGFVEDNKVLLPPKCPKCGGYIVFDMSKYRFYGAVCLDCGEFFTKLIYAESIASMKINPSVVEQPSEELLWMLKDTK